MNVVETEREFEGIPADDPISTSGGFELLYDGKEREENKGAMGGLGVLAQIGIAF